MLHLIQNIRIMATTKRELSTRINSVGKSEIFIRLTVGRGLQPRLKSGFFIVPERMKKNGVIAPPRKATSEEITELRKIESGVTAFEQHMLDICASTPRERLTKEYLSEMADRYRNPDKYLQKKADATDFFKVFDTFLSKQQLSHGRINHYKVLIRALRRFEMYTAILYGPYTLTLDGLTAKDIERFEAFLRAEPGLFDRYPEIYRTAPVDSHRLHKPRRPLPKGDNTLCGLLKCFRAFLNWCNMQELTDNKPFARFSGIPSETYGTPYYISIEERDKIADFDLSDNKGLEVQRDIFVFHCLIGCRVSDLLRLTPDSIINGAVEYIAGKTSKERPEVIRVPLHPRAAALVDKYAGHKPGKLFPFISSQKYNEAIKRIFTVCGITRTVTTLNSVTGKEERRPINEIASSHIARRTFVGNLYKKVKDPNLVGKLSGHKEGSKAFARYRDIDEDMKKELIGLL